jgi:hypothetical protein
LLRKWQFYEKYGIFFEQKGGTNPFLLMKISFFMFVFLAAFSLQAQDASKVRKNFLKLNIVSPLDNIFAFSYERKLNSETSW